MKRHCAGEGLKRGADDIVRELGIDRIQGYYYARPMAIEEFAWLISERCPICPIPTAKND
jgi:predicted signal transduction protein with EAL and GGDEF domain